MTKHTWAGIHVSFSNAAWRRLPPDLQQLADREFNAKALLERADWQVMTMNETKILERRGMVFNSPDTKPFQDELRKSGFYADMKTESGDQAWALLEQYVGPLA
jgi:TRAP-type C4-dicarboxylate transport system substrate-binding protein